jgi:hypothetical protein
LIFHNPKFSYFNSSGYNGVSIADGYGSTEATVFAVYNKKDFLNTIGGI